MTNNLVSQAVDFIRSKIPQDFIPKLALVLGSGLGSTADVIDPVAEITYADIPGFHAGHVVGHRGKLLLGYLSGIPLVCLQGRAHFYEGTSFQAMRTMVRSLKVLGCEILLLTNASGSLREDAGPGSIMLINDHINFQGTNPLLGPNDDEFGPRFLPMDHAYDVHIRERFKSIANEHDLFLSEGVYMGVLGPNYETPAEIRAFRVLGADAVGMSTVPEVLLARHCGLRVGCLAIITNYGAGMDPGSLSHEETVKQASGAAKNVITLLQLFTDSLKNDPL